MTQRLSWAVLRRGRSLWSRNATPGATVYGEALRRIDGKEHRRWDPTRSKIGSALLRSKEPLRLLPEPGRTALYLGAGHGTTISHLHDHLCGAEKHREGRLIAVDLAPRCMRDLTHLARQRPGIVPVLGDARRHEAWAGLPSLGSLGCSKMWLRPPKRTSSSPRLALPRTRRNRDPLLEGGVRTLRCWARLRVRWGGIIAGGRRFGDR